MGYSIHQKTTFFRGRSFNSGLLTQELEAVFDEHSLHDESDATLPLVLEAVCAELHANPDVQLHEALDAIQVPGVEVDVVDGRGQHQDAVQLTNPLFREVDLYTVEQGMLKDIRVVDLNMENGTYGWVEPNE